MIKLIGYKTLTKRISNVHKRIHFGGGGCLNHSTLSVVFAK